MIQRKQTPQRTDEIQKVEVLEFTQSSSARQLVETPAVRDIFNVCDLDTPSLAGAAGSINASTPTLFGIDIIKHMKGINPDAKIADLGSGCGKFCFMTRLAFPNTEVVGFELNPQLAAASRKNQEKLAHIPGVKDTIFKERDFLKEDLTGFDLLYLFYTVPEERCKTAEEYNRKLAQKLAGDGGMKKGAKLIVLGEVGEIQSEDLKREKIKVGEFPLTIITKT
jgi:hypothetical protein